MDAYTISKLASEAGANVHTSAAHPKLAFIHMGCSGGADVPLSFATTRCRARRHERRGFCRRPLLGRCSPGTDQSAAGLRQKGK